MIRDAAVKSINETEGFMYKSKLFQTAICALVLTVLLPLTSFAQRRWVVVRPHRSRVVVYQPQPYVVYQRPYYRTYTYGSYGYSQPYYENRYYSYGYSQPYFANQYTYSWANPTYSYDEYGYRYRRHHHRSGIRILLR